MAEDREAYYRGLAEQAIRDAGIAEPPVSTAAVARHLGIPVLAVELPPWSTGALIYEDGMPLALLNRTKEAFTQSTALGHLLGHVLVVLDDPGATYPRNGEASHSAADAMAEELELPGFMVLEQAAKWFNDYRYLAGLFGVTEKRMFERMQKLGLVRSRGIVWDY